MKIKIRKSKNTDIRADAFNQLSEKGQIFKVENISEPHILTEYDMIQDLQKRVESLEKQIKLLKGENYEHVRFG